MHIFQKALVILLCATFSATIQADDFVSLVDQNFPYQEVDETYGVAKIADGGCKEGTPFTFSQDSSQTSSNMDVATQIHQIIRGLGANAFVITELEEDTHVRSMTVTPLTCSLG